MTMKYIYCYSCQKPVYRFFAAGTGNKNTPPRAIHLKKPGVAYSTMSYRGPATPRACPHCARMHGGVNFADGVAYAMRIDTDTTAGTYIVNKWLCGNCRLPRCDHQEDDRCLFTPHHTHYKPYAAQWLGYHPTKGSYEEAEA